MSSTIPASRAYHGYRATSTGAAPPHRARHCLVVATQCPAADRELPELTDAARELHRALTDPAIGACRDDPSPAAVRVRSGDADQAAVEAAVRQAIERAGREHAVLVLALLGHGQSPGAANLYYMASNSLPEDASSSVDVNSLIAGAANRAGIAGVIVLLDTCQSGAALNAAHALVAGFRDGETRASVLTATSAGEPAYDLDFTRRLTQLMREGFDDADEFVSVPFYRAALVDALPNQDAKSLDYNGMPTAGQDGLWLAVNARRRPVKGAEDLGAIGTRDLAAALRAWPGRTADGEDGDGPGGRDGRDTAFRGYDDLATLRERAARSPDFAALRVREVADALLLVRETELFLVRWAGRELTSYTVHRAMAVLNTRGPEAYEPMRTEPGLSGSELLRAFLEYAALRQTSVDGRRTARQALCRCVVAVAEVCELDACDDEVQVWADAHSLTVEFNDARAWSGQQRRRHGAGLVVSLHAARIDWPESLSVWLRRGDECLPPTVLPCTPTQSGVENALAEVVDWAEDQLPPGERVDHLDVVVPAALLPGWRPEEAQAGIYLLGVDRTVVLRWADRLFAPRYFRSLNALARRRLIEWQHHVLTTGQAPVDWLSALETAHTDQLIEMLRAGRYRRAIGIRHRPDDLAELVQTLLPYSPVLLWPGERDHVVERPPDALARYWERLPAAFTRAHRARWSAAGWDGGGYGDGYGDGSGYGGCGPGDGCGAVDGDCGCESGDGCRGNGGLCAGGSAREGGTGAGGADDGGPGGDGPRGDGEDAHLAELGALRTAWHDLAWLDFCRWFQGTATTSATTPAGSTA